MQLYKIEFVDRLNLFIIASSFKSAVKIAEMKGIIKSCEEVWAEVIVEENFLATKDKN